MSIGRMATISLVLTTALLYGGVSAAQYPTEQPPALFISALDTLHRADIPFDYAPPIKPVITIQAKINGNGPYTFLVDTGFSDVLLLDDKLANVLKLKKTGSVVRISPGNHKSVELDTLTVTLVTKAGPPSINVKLDGALAMHVKPASKKFEGPDFSGVIGAGLLKRFTAVFDFSTSTMSLYYEPHPPISQEGFVALPIHEIERSSYFVSITQERGRTVDALIDTGSTHTSLPAEASALDVAKGLGSAGSVDMAGEAEELTYLVPAITLGNPLSLSSVREPDVTLFRNDTGEAAGLGMDVLSRFRVILDFRNGFLLLQRGRDYEQRKVCLGDSGIVLGGRKAPYTVKKVEKGVTADIKVGDRVTKIDGLSLDGILPHTAQFLIDGYAGRAGTIEVIRKSDPPNVVTIDRKNAFDFPFSDRPVNVHKFKRDYFASHIRGGNDFFVHNLSVGDVIAKVNGNDARKLSLRVVESSFSRTGFRISIRRGSEQALRELTINRPH